MDRMGGEEERSGEEENHFCACQGNSAAGCVACENWRLTVGCKTRLRGGFAAWRLQIDPGVFEGEQRGLPGDLAVVRGREAEAGEDIFRFAAVWGRLRKFDSKPTSR
jgi:hypothetical protein